MSQFQNLSAQEIARVKSKLDALHEMTWKSWDFAVTQQPGNANSGPLLEIIVDGRVAKPIALPQEAEMPAEVICRYLDDFARSRTV